MSKKSKLRVRIANVHADELERTVYELLSEGASIVAIVPAHILDGFVDRYRVVHYTRAALRAPEERES